MFKKIVSMFMGASVLMLPFAFTMPAVAVTTTWDVTGEYVIAVDYEGTDYLHDLSLTQDEDGDLTGNGGSPAGSNVYTWVLTSGMVVGNAIDFLADYTATPDAVTPQTTMHVVGTIAEDGTMSGTWTDNYNGGDRSGSWTSTEGNASPAGSLAAEDFGVVNYDTGLGILKGYSAGFGLTNATFSGAQSVIVQLFAGDTLLQTNTGTEKIGDEIIGNQISSPFDVSGDFDYVTDGYWTNARESEYGQSVPATKVVATVILENGKTVTAENTNLSGDPTTIYPDPVTATTTVKVTVEKFVNGTMATAASADNSDFPMYSTWDAENIGAGAGNYVLSETNTTPYQAVTADMTMGADYSTKEKVNGSVVGAQCDTGEPYALKGYTTGDTRAAAIAATPTMTEPSFTNLQTNKYVIVWNTDCSNPSGEIGGEVVGSDGVLEVTSIEMIDTSATANGTFTDGWEYVFHITAPSSEEDISMKFSDWLRTEGSGTIPVANNMRISSAQADNGGATILLTAANVYSAPALHMDGDLDPVMAGRQIEVTVEVAVPAGTPNGSYTTSYGVQSN
ncbi:MAG: hypothetical protein UW75_C0035G0002 [Parcubacteria group bacterium GW2011_GWF2_44_8]|nr:MAG: hypothetical protein UW75_C0035G0002 [Parcubacteria group bacterium GW2011_GWF2_44_8]